MFIIVGWKGISRAVQMLLATDTLNEASAAEHSRRRDVYRTHNRNTERNLKKVTHFQSVQVLNVINGNPIPGSNDSCAAAATSRTC